MQATATRVRQRPPRTDAERARLAAWHPWGATKWTRIARFWSPGEVSQVRLVIERRGRYFRCSVREGYEETVLGYEARRSTARTTLDAFIRAFRGCA